MDGAERSIDPDVLTPDLLGDLLDDGSHLDGSSLVDLHLHLLSQLVFVQQLAEVAVVLGLLGTALHLMLVVLLLLLVLEVLCVVLLLARLLLVDGGLELLLLVVVAASRLLPIHYHHLIVGRHRTKSITAA